jgi:hypothetical protein
MHAPQSSGPCARCEALAARLGTRVQLNVDGQLGERDWHLLARELDTAIARLMACPGEGRPGCVQHDASELAAVALAAAAARSNNETR